MKCLLQNNVLELGKGNFWQFNLTFYSSEIHSSTIFLRLGFSIAAAILSLSLICLLTEERKQRESGILWVKERNYIDTVHSYSCDLITNQVNFTEWERVLGLCYLYPQSGFNTRQTLFCELDRPFLSWPKALFQCKAKCEAIDLKMIFFNSHANKTHFHKKGFALSLVLKVRLFGTPKWPIQPTELKLASSDFW